MNARKSFVVVTILMIVALFATACSAVATPAPAPPQIQRETASGPQHAPAQPTLAPAPTAVPAAPGALADKISGPPASNASGVSASPFSNTRMIIKNGEMNLMVVDTDRAVDQVSSVAVGMGGYVVSAKTWTQDTFKYASIRWACRSNSLRRLNANSARWRWKC